MLGQSLCFFLLVITSVSVAVGQNDPRDLTEATLEELSNIQVYSASKHLQAVRDAPSSITVVTADEIQRFGYRTLADVLRGVRGFYITGDRMYHYVGVRGFGRIGDYNSRILLLINGHRANDNVYDQAMVGTESPIDIDVVDRIEIIRGPSSSLYGSNALLGVINVITKKADALTGPELAFETGSWGTYKGRASYGLNVRDADLLASVTFYDSAGRTLFFPALQDRPISNGVSKDRDYDSFIDSLLSVSWRGVRIQAIDNSRRKGIPTAAFGTIFADARTRSIDEHQFLDLSFERDVAGMLLNLRTYYDRYAYDGYWPFTTQGVNVDYARGQRWGLDVQLARTLRQKHRLTIGSEARDNFQQAQKNYDTMPALIYINDNRRSWMGAAFGQDEYAVTSNLNLNIGARYDRYGRYGGSTSPRIALIYHPTKQNSLKLIYGSAFRPPNVFEAYYGTDSVKLPGYERNPHLKPERMENFEAIWEQTVATRFELSAGVFHNRMDHLISPQLDAANGVLVYVNSQLTSSTGSESELRAHLPHGVDSRVSYTYSHTEGGSGSQLQVNSPRHLAQFRVAAPLVREKLFASLEGLYMSSRLTAGQELAPGFVTSNFTIVGHLGSHTDLSASIYNLSNQHYADPVGEEVRQNPLPQDGRSFRLKLTWRWGDRQ